jgi:hypothetical protein
MALNALVLLILWAAPHSPFSILLWPPIRAFAGESALHYPWHLMWVFRSMPAAQATSMLMLGAMLGGVASLLAARMCAGQAASMRLALSFGWTRAFRCTAAWAAVWLLSLALARGIQRFFPASVVSLWSNVAAAACLQALAVYAIPAIALSGLSWWRGLLASAQQALRHPAQTLAVVFLPLVAVLATSFVLCPQRIAFWMDKYEPEIVLPAILARLAVWTVADAFMTVAAAVAWQRSAHA